MAFTFGAGTGDDINAALNIVQAGSSNSNFFMCGWFYPTTLTAGRYYFSFGNTYGVKVDGTTSELRMMTDNTTDGEWVTSGAAISVDKWWFLAFANACENVAVDGAWRCWVGDINTAPVEITVTNPVTRSGNYSSSGTLVLGNGGTAGTVAFQGDIGNFNYIAVGNPAINCFSTVSTSGVISDGNADILYRRFVLPFWRGRPKKGLLVPATILNSLVALSIDLNTPLPIGYQYCSATVGLVPTALGISGATFSQNRSPLILPPYWPARG